MTHFYLAAVAALVAVAPATSAKAHACPLPQSVNAISAALDAAIGGRADKNPRLVKFTSSEFGNGAHLWSTYVLEVHGAAAAVVRVSHSEPRAAAEVFNCAEYQAA